ncbi:MAG: inositol monophosphatase family protein [Desulfobacteraceae bacterium]|nr:inositol monophosphatase family protein [Desulfobacteraceae bacterium]
MDERCTACTEASRPEWATILEPAVRAALAAGAVIRARYGRPHQIGHKGEIDLVTEADTAAEREIIAILREELPQIGVMAEESSQSYQEIPPEPTWVIDPLDGTTNFAHGFPWFATSIGCLVEGISVAGVIYLPMQDELFCATRGGGAWLNGKRLQVSTASGLKQSLMATGFPYNIQEKPEPVIAALRAVLTRAQGVRRAGAAAIDLAYVACGRLDGFYEINLKPWDAAAGFLLVEEAGGKVTDFRGRPFSPFVPELLATNGRIHEEMSGVLREFSLLP